MVDGLQGGMVTQLCLIDERETDDSYVNDEDGSRLTLS